MGKARRAFIKARLLVEKAREKARKEAEKGWRRTNAKLVILLPCRDMALRYGSSGLLLLRPWRKGGGYT